MTEVADTVGVQGPGCTSLICRTQAEEILDERGLPDPVEAGESEALRALDGERAIRAVKFGDPPARRHVRVGQVEADPLIGSHASSS